MSAGKLRALYRIGRTYDEIAEANYRSEGWRPSRSAVLRKLQVMDLPPRYSGHSDLIPWNVRPEHNTSVIRHMLQAESRRRQGQPLKSTDKKLIARLEELLHGRGQLMVVAYHPDTGFSIVMREDDDEDIIRLPRKTEHLRKEVRAALREQLTEDYDEATAHRVLRAVENEPQPSEGAGHLDCG